jgi:hypothetical protein
MLLFFWQREGCTSEGRMDGGVVAHACVVCETGPSHVSRVTPTYPVPPSVPHAPVLFV